MLGEVGLARVLCMTLIPEGQRTLGRDRAIGLPAMDM